MNRPLAATSLSILLALAACTSAAQRTAPSTLPPGAVPLFQGNSFAGWKTPATTLNTTPNPLAPPAPFWSFAPDGTLTAENDPALHGYDLYTRKSYKDLEFHIEFRYTGDADSGVYLRKPLIQVQIGVSSSLHTEKTGSLFQEGRGGGYVANAHGTDLLLKPGDWNDLRFIAQGDNLKVWLNGRQVLDTSIAKYPNPAPLGLQLHPGIKMKIQFRHGWLREL